MISDNQDKMSFYFSVELLTFIKQVPMIGHSLYLVQTGILDTEITECVDYSDTVVFIDTMV